jgi:hypothetical protein
MVPPHCYHDCLVMDVKEPFDPVNRLLEDLMCVSLLRAPPLLLHFVPTAHTILAAG